MADIKQNDYDTHFRNNYETSSYYNKDRNWDDYGPAYNYAYTSRTGEYASRKFDEVESDLERGWDKTKANSRLAWSEAKDAVKDGWHYIERALPGDADRDGR